MYIRYYDPDKNKIIEEKHPGINFLYNNLFGRMITKLLITKPVSITCGFFLNTRISKLFINNFIKKNNIDMSLYEEKKYKSFNDFFLREIKKEYRLVSQNDNDLIAICDSKLSVYKIEKDLTLNIKNSLYTTKELIKKDLDKSYVGGYALIFRLCTNDYHHYCFLDNGKILDNYKIKGQFHTANPIALRKYKVFKENQREVSILETKNFGKVIEIEVGALNVGKIHNLDKKEFIKGEEKGYFSLGGSTIILLIQKDKLVISKNILNRSKKDIETKVIQGEIIGQKLTSN